MVTPRNYTHNHRLATFPLGGIGTGNISIGANGMLCDAEMFGRPDKGHKPPFSFFALYTRQGDGKAEARLLEAGAPPHFDESKGWHPGYVMDLPRMRASTMTVRYPFATIDFDDDALPLAVWMEAFTPFIPPDADASGIPAAMFSIRLRNRSESPVHAMLSFSFPNICGYEGGGSLDARRLPGGRRNERRGEGGLSGVWMTRDGGSQGSLRRADFAILTDAPDALVKPEWYRGGWSDGIRNFWDEWRQGVFSQQTCQRPKQSVLGSSGHLVASLCAKVDLSPGEEKTIRFVLAWYVPNRPRGWYPAADDGDTLRNHYAARYDSAWAASADLFARFDHLYGQSRRFADALYGMDLPEYVVDALAAGLATLRSNTCFRVEGGAFFAWEGCHLQAGSCPGTCTHVWNYAQTVAYLFPELERSARENEFLREIRDDGSLSFRAMRAFGLAQDAMLPASDGELGAIMRVWREYSLCGDKAFLRRLWPSMRRVMRHVRDSWDAEDTGLLRGPQHNTYDIEFYGSTPLSAVLYIGALAAMERAAAALGETEEASAFQAARARAANAVDQAPYNGAYYEQRGIAPDENDYQFGTGCLSDQLLGQTLAHLTGLGHLLPQAHVKSAARAIYDHNMQGGDTRDTCYERPFPYAEEIWTGVEYQVATLLIYEDFTEEAFDIVRHVRARYDGIRRNPWRETECGHHYARSLSSWGLLVALRDHAPQFK